MRYLILSDESGNWNSQNYYIRSWLKIEEQKYDDLIKEILFIKYVLNIQELKWNSFTKNYHCLNSKGKLKGLMNLDFKVFITITDPNHFMNKNYNIFETLRSINILSDIPKSIDKQRLKRRLKNTIKTEYFFSIYDYWHIKNAQMALMSDANDIYEVIVDKPPYPMWEELANSCGIKAKMKDSKEEKGIQLADVFCGCVKDCIDGDHKAKKIYNDCFKRHMRNMYDKDCPNPNLIFYDDFNDKERQRLDIFR